MGFIRRIAMIFNWKRRAEEKLAEAEAAALAAERKKKAMDGFDTLSGLLAEESRITEKIEPTHLAHARNNDE